MKRTGRSNLELIMVTFLHCRLQLRIDNLCA